MDLIETFFNADVLVRALPLLTTGLITTLQLGVTSIAAGSIVGLVLALLRLYAPRPLSIAAVVVIDVFRAVPVLVLLILIYYALPFLGIRLSSFVSAWFALSLVFGAFTAEVLRSGIEAIPKGQFEAAAAMGLSFPQTIRLVILPQATKIAIPPQTSNCISLLKDTSLASVVAMPDLLKQATDAQAFFGNPTPLIGAALVYLAILWPLVRLVGVLEERSKRSAAR
ncbi:amino acid ABC transporter permease [Salinarimonas ramus]|uniref:ABC transporter permease n=1 Tax=Salinarimonas ramus TaxID=690164 RepID=A0A917V1R3_9HYPH|nr:amino acid ABC transporter permease [Salinarimonas ramus]GGK21784.1 ABC transporter permease [Salinarimonas ramus]